MILNDFSLQICLQIIQKLITNGLIDQKGALYITDTLWALMELGIEEVKILQTVTLLLTTNTVVHGDTLARVSNCQTLIPTLLSFGWTQSFS